MKLSYFKSHSTLQLSFPFGQTAVLALLMLALLVGILEIVLRLPSVTSRLPAPSIGSNIDILEANFHLLDTFADKGPVDCLFVGNSEVYTSVNPVTFGQIYQERTGKPIRCFIFGVGAMTASGTQIIAQYLINTYHPKLLLVGLSTRDFSSTAVDQGVSASDLVNLPWIKYKRGTFSLEGWMFTHSSLYRYYKVYARWMNSTFEEDFVKRREVETAVADMDGYRPYRMTLSFPLSDAEQKRVKRLFSNYTPVPAELDGLKALIALNHPSQTQVVLFETPVHPLIVTDYLGADVYQHFNAMIQDYATAGGVIYWTCDQLQFVPKNWANLNHLNVKGAEVFSRWLGEQVGTAVSEGRLVPPKW